MLRLTTGRKKAKILYVIKMAALGAVPVGQEGRGGGRGRRFLLHILSGAYSGAGSGKEWLGGPICSEGRTSAILDGFSYHGKDACRAEAPRSRLQYGERFGAVRYPGGCLCACRIQPARAGSCRRGESPAMDFRIFPIRSLQRWDAEGCKGANK